MSQQQHIIGRTQLQINSDRLGEMWRFQQEMSDIFYERAIPSLEQLFDQLVDVDERVRLEQVVVELPPLDPDNLAEDFVSNLLAALQDLLGDRLEKAGGRGQKAEGRGQEAEGRGAAQGEVYSLLEGAPKQEVEDGMQGDLNPSLVQENLKALGEKLKPSGVSPTSSEEQLTQPLSETVTSSLHQGDRQQAAWEVFLYFLQYGRLPWWCLENDWKTFLTNWDRIIQQKNQDVTALRTLFKTSISARKRLVRQFSPAFRQQIVLLLQPRWVNLSRRLREAQQLMKALSLSDHLTRTLENQTWLWILTQLATTSSDRSFPTSDWLEVWFSDLLEGMSQEGLITQLDRPIQSPSFPSGDRCLNRDTSETDKTKNSLFSSYLKTVIESLNVADLPLWFRTIEEGTRQVYTEQSRSEAGGRRDNLMGIQTPTNCEHRADGGVLNHKVEESGSECLIPRKPGNVRNTQESAETNSMKEQPSAFCLDALSNGEETSPGVAPLPPASQPKADQTFRKDRLEEEQPYENKENDPSVNSDQKPSKTVSERPFIPRQNNLPQTQETVLSPEERDLGLFINHAGLVILYPFLSVYFETVGLWKEGRWCNPTTQEMAIYLLYYLATGKTNAPEYELVLPKLLCGWCLNEPVIPPRTFPKDALTEAENLLQTLITYWSVLKSTSPDGLREGFLQRGGKLTTLDQGDWQLQVEQTAIDVLLSRLPWGLNVIKLPWMETLLMVQWI